MSTLREHRLKFICLAASLVTLAVRFADAQTSEQPLTLVVKGGISLGAYQAGVAYAVVKALRLDSSTSTSAADVLSRVDWLKDAKITIATGASAGNVNTVLAALSTCDVRGDSVELFANPFFDAWINIGWDTLLPAPEHKDPDGRSNLFRRFVGSADYRSVANRVADRDASLQECLTNPDETEGLVSRRGFDPMLAHVCTMMRTRHFREGCRVDIGITLTRAQATQISPRSDTDTMRYFAPFSLTSTSCTSSGCYLLPEPLPVEEHAANEKVVYPNIPKDGDQQISLESVTRIIQASAAFPVAFAPLELKYCQDARCEKRAKPARFLDGGFFDNVPLGLAVTLSKVRTSSPTPNLLFINPELIRRRQRTSAPKPPSAFGDVAAIGDDVIAEARGYELQGLIRFERMLRQATDRKRDPIHISSRYYRLYGSEFLAFGAFLHRELRYADYLTGVYDGIRMIAIAAQEQPDDHDKYIKSFEALLEPLVPAGESALPGVGVPRAFIRFLRDRELAETFGIRAAKACRRLGRDVGFPNVHGRLSCLRPKQKKSWDDPAITGLLPLHLALQPLAGEETPEDLDRLCGPQSEQTCFAAVVPRIVARLRQQGVGSELGSLSWDDWKHYTAQEFTRRLREIEDADSKNEKNARYKTSDRLLGQPIGDYLALAEALIALTLAPDDDRVSFGSPIVMETPGWRAKLALLLPHHVVWDATDGGLQVAWEAKLRLWDRLYIPGTGGLVHRFEDRFGDRTSPRVTGGVGVAPSDGWISHAEALAVYEPSVSGQTGPLGIEFGVRVFRFLRFGLGMRDVFIKRGAQIDRFSPYVSLGFSEVSGLLLMVGRYTFGEPL